MTLWVVATIMNYNLWGSLFWSFDAASWVLLCWNTGWFRRKGQCFGGWYYQSLWKKKFTWICVRFLMVTDIELFGSVWSPDLTMLDFCLWGWMESEVYKRKVATRDDCSLPFRMLPPAWRKWRSTQMNNTQSSHTRCNVHRGWWWDFRTFILNCNTFVI